jgi:hypothetical protein
VFYAVDSFYGVNHLTIERMKNMKLNFVDQYKAIFDLEKNHCLYDANPYKMRQIIEFIIIFIFAATLIGWIFNLLSNFNYIFIMINAICIIAYTMYSISSTIPLHENEQMPYSLLSIVLVDVSCTLSSIVIWQVLIYVLYLEFTGSLVILVLFMIVSLVLVSVTFVASLEDEFFMIRSFFRGISFTAIQIVIILLNPINDLISNFLLSLLVVIGYIVMIQLKNKKLIIKKVFLGLFHFLLIFGLYLLPFIIINKEYDHFFKYDISSDDNTLIDLNRVETPYLRDTHSYWNVYKRDDKYLIQEHRISTTSGMVIETFVNIYDKQGNHMQRIKAPFPYFQVVDSQDDFYISINTTEVSLASGSHIDDSGELMSFLYRLTDQFTFEKILQIPSEEHFNLVYEKDQGFYLFHDSNVAYYNTITDQLEWKDMTKLEDVFIDEDYYYIVENNQAYTNMFRAINHPLNYLPFWNQKIYAYHDGYALSFSGEYYNHNIVLIDVESQRVISASELPYLARDIKRLDRENSLVFFYESLIYDVQKNKTFELYEPYTKQFFQQENMMITKQTGLSIYIEDLDEGYKLNQVVNTQRFGSEVYVIVGMLYLMVFGLINSFHSKDKY